VKAAPSRQRVITEIKVKHGSQDARIRMWSQTDLTGVVPEKEWSETHAGSCATCGRVGARLYAAGWACDEHRPRRNTGVRS
jgi:hypothetical protein